MEHKGPVFVLVPQTCVNTQKMASENDDMPILSPKKPMDVSNIPLPREKRKATDDGDKQSKRPESDDSGDTISSVTSVFYRVDWSSFIPMRMYCIYSHKLVQKSYHIWLPRVIDSCLCCVEIVK